MANKLTGKERKIIANFKKENKHICNYCNKPLDDTELTVDHMTPRVRGGKTIPENLCIACKECNCDKAFFTQAEYKYYRETRDKEFKNKVNDVINRVTRKVEKARCIEIIDISSIAIPNLFKNSKASLKKYKHKREYFEKYGDFYKCIVIDEENTLLDGYINYLVCKDLNVNTVKCIKIDTEIILQCGA